jgi:hypothetical protein
VKVIGCGGNGIRSPGFFREKNSLLLLENIDGARELAD